MREILRAGARGYLLKDSIDSDLVSAVRADAKGDGYLHRGKIMEKLNLHSTGELVRFAVRNGLVD